MRQASGVHSWTAHQLAGTSGSVSDGAEATAGPSRTRGRGRDGAHLGVFSAATGRVPSTRTSRRLSGQGSQPGLERARRPESPRSLAFRVRVYLVSAGCSPVLESDGGDSERLTAPSPATLCPPPPPPQARAARHRFAVSDPKRHVGMFLVGLGCLPLRSARHCDAEGGGARGWLSLRAGARRVGCAARLSGRPLGPGLQSPPCRRGPASPWWAPRPPAPAEQTTRTRPLCPCVTASGVPRADCTAGQPVWLSCPGACVTLIQGRPSAESVQP